ncbi:MAG: signal peptidase I [Parcubacteria group bacterium]|nr:signal peptidase I [Parcubacteria group bacterium]
MNEEKNITSTEKPLESFWKEILKFALIAVIIIVPFRLYIAQPFIVSGASMDPTFETGQYLIVDQLTYHFETPQRGSVLIFKYPKDPSKYYIKRIIGLPGETLEINGEIVTIKNTDNPDGFVLSEPYVVYKKQNNTNVTLRDDEYFVMGDNRIGSSDSRYWGPVAKNFIIGRPVLRLLPVTLVSLFPGDYSEK